MPNQGRNSTKVQQQFKDSRARKEGYSRQIQGFKQFQDSADQSRKNFQADSQVHSDLAKRPNTN